VPDGATKVQSGENGVGESSAERDVRRMAGDVVTEVGSARDVEVLGFNEDFGGAVAGFCEVQGLFWAGRPRGRLRARSFWARLKAHLVPVAAL